MRNRTPPIVLCLAMVLGACYPSLHLETRSPSVTGIILAAGEPLPNRKVALSIQRRDGTCAQPAATSRTDDQGGFEFDAIRHFVFAKYPSAEYMFNFRVCLVDQEPPLYLWGDSLSLDSIFSPPYRLHLDCELTNTARPQGLCDARSSPH